MPLLLRSSNTPLESPAPKELWRRSTRKMETRVREHTQKFMVVGFELAKDEKLEMSGTLNLNEDEDRGFVNNHTQVSGIDGVLTAQKDAEVGYATFPNVKPAKTSELESYIAEFKSEWNLPNSINEGAAVYWERKKKAFAKVSTKTKSIKNLLIGAAMMEVIMGDMKVEPANVPAFTDNKGAMPPIKPVADPNDPMVGLERSPGPDKEQTNRIIPLLADITVGIEPISKKVRDKEIRKLPVFEHLAETYFRNPVHVPAPEPECLHKEWVYDSDSADEDGGVKIGDGRTLYEELRDFRDACKKMRGSIIETWSLSRIAEFVTENEKNWSEFKSFQAFMLKFKNFQKVVVNAAH